MMDTITSVGSGIRFDLLYQAYKDGKLTLNQFQNSFNTLADAVRENELSFDSFVSQSHINIIGKNLGRSRSTYLHDSKSHKRIYEMAKSQVSYINDTLNKDPKNKVLVIMPFKLKGFHDLGRLATYGLKSYSSEWVERCRKLMSPDKEFCDEFGIDMNNPHDRIDLDYIMDWVKDRIIDKSRVVFCNGNRQLFQEENVANRIVRAINKGCNHICFFFKPVRNNKRYKYECGALYNKGITKYTDATINWIKWVMNIVNTNRNVNASDIHFTFSQDYRTEINKFQSEFGLTVNNDLADNYNAYVKIVTNRIQHAIDTEIKNCTDIHFFNMINHFENLLKNNINSQELTIKEIAEIMGYESKLSNIVYRLNSRRINNFFNIELISDTGKSYERKYRISLHERFLNCNNEFKSIQSRGKYRLKSAEIEIVDKTLSTEEIKEIDKCYENYKTKTIGIWNRTFFRLFDYFAQNNLNEGLTTLTTCEERTEDIDNKNIINKVININYIKYKVKSIINYISRSILSIQKQLNVIYNSLLNFLSELNNLNKCNSNFLVLYFKQIDEFFMELAKFALDKTFTFSKGFETC